MSAPNLKEIEWAIHELEQEESSFPVYAKLANLYTVRNELMGMSAAQPQIAAYSEAGIPASEMIGLYGDSDFLHAVSGKDHAAAWSIMDELMEILRVVNPRAYESVLRKINRL
ncbi:hypothetical protein AALA54_07015 [Oscillospiraceae bacterium 44-34]